MYDKHFYYEALVMAKKHQNYTITLGKDMGKSLEKPAAKRSITITSLVKTIIAEWLKIDKL